jgi:putative nucleotidyltransferase with HDIG domain
VLRGDDSETVIQSCRGALTTQGVGFEITSSYGVVLMPADTTDPDVALRLADDRMYAHKNSGRASASQQTRDLALKVLSVGEPDVQAHSVNVAMLVERVSRRLGLEGPELTDVVRAAELHDIGKIAIPFAVLHKPGPLDEEEWELMRSHATIGANILSAAPALAGVAEIVRATHERVDGQGYPHGLAGEQIPLPSRIVFVCDAFDAMISERPYGAALTTDEAVAELRSNAGTQFDPAVVDAFCAELAQSAPDDAPTPRTRTNVPRPIRA